MVLCGKSRDPASISVRPFHMRVAGVCRLSAHRPARTLRCCAAQEGGGCWDSQSRNLGDGGEQEPSFLPLPWDPVPALPVIHAPGLSLSSCPPHPCSMGTLGHLGPPLACAN